MFQSQHACFQVCFFSLLFFCTNPRATHVLTLWNDIPSKGNSYIFAFNFFAVTFVSLDNASQKKGVIKQNNNFLPVDNDHRLCTVYERVFNAAQNYSGREHRNHYHIVIDQLLSLCIIARMTISFKRS